MVKFLNHLFVFLFVILGIYSNAQNFSKPIKALQKGDYIPNTIILKVKENYRNSCTESEIKLSEFKSICTDYGIFYIEKIFKNELPPKEKYNAWHQANADLSLIYEIKYSKNISIDNVIFSLLKSNLFEYAEPHFLPKPTYTPNDPLATPSGQYHLQNINAFSAWDINQGDSSIIIGITDTGTDPGHEDLFNNIARNYNDPIDHIDNDGDGYIDNYMGWDLGMNDYDPTWESNPHGVHVCGISGASINNSLGGAGVGFNCKILPVKISDANGNLIAAYEGIKYAADHGCQIINCSWGANSGGQYGQDIITYATINKNCLVVAAAGNNGNELLFFPAAYDGVLAVANTNASDVLTYGSDYGYFVDVCAPGDNITSTWPGNNYSGLTGTSMSSPCVAGAAGIVKNQFPMYNGLQIAERLKVTADNIYPLNNSYLNKLGTGRVNLYRALTDPDGPSVVFSERVDSDHKNNSFLSGDTLFITGKFTNYLSPTSALTATLNSLSAYALAIDNITGLGVINTLSYKTNHSDPFQFKLNGTIPLNQSIDFRLDIQDGSYQSHVFFTLNINLDYIDININNIETSATSKGKIGYNLNGQTQGLGFKYKGTDILYESGLMIGIDTNHVSDCVRGSNPSIDDQDFSTIYRAQKIVPSSVSDFDTDAGFTDAASSNPIHINIEQKTRAWANSPNQKFVIWEYTITNNNTNDTLKNLYAGIFADWDIDGGTYNENRSAYDNPNKMGYSYYTGTNGIYAGIKLLTSSVTPVFYAIDNVNGGNGGVDPSNGMTTKEKYQTLSTNRLNAGASGNGNDIINVMSAGPVQLKPGESTTIAFALIAGDSLSDLKNSAISAQIKYNGLTTTVNQISNSKIFIYPNPADKEVFIKTKSELAEIKIFNMNGELVFFEKNQSNNSVNISDLTEGIYILYVKTKQESFYHKLMVKH